jgi:hypothetical protein
MLLASMIRRLRASIMFLLFTRVCHLVWPIYLQASVQGLEPLYPSSMLENETIDMPKAVTHSMFKSCV